MILEVEGKAKRIEAEGGNQRQGSQGGLRA